jgi:hypothetical protein
MAKITYLDPNDDAPVVIWHGVKFKAEVPQEVDDLMHAGLIEQASTHPYFKVEDYSKGPEAKQAELAPTGKPTWPEDEEPKAKAKR